MMVADSINKKRKHSKVIAAVVIVVGIALIPALYAYSQVRFPLTSYTMTIGGGITYDAHELRVGDTMYGFLYITGERVDVMVLDKQTFFYMSENLELPPGATPEVYFPGTIGDVEFQFTAMKADTYYLVFDPQCFIFCSPTSVDVNLQRSLGIVVILYAIPAVMISLGAVFLVYLSLRRK